MSGWWGEAEVPEENLRTEGAFQISGRMSSRWRKSVQLHLLLPSTLTEENPRRNLREHAISTNKSPGLGIEPMTLGDERTRRQRKEIHMSRE